MKSNVVISVVAVAMIIFFVMVALIVNINKDVDEMTITISQLRDKNIELLEEKIELQQYLSESMSLLDEYFDRFIRPKIEANPEAYKSLYPNTKPDTLKQCQPDII